MNGTDLGTTPRQRLTAGHRLRIWERDRGICCLCGRLIGGVREECFIEHKRALELGRTNDDDNLAPAHRSCRPVKDAADHRRAAKTKWVKQRCLEIRPSRRQPVPGSRSSDVRMTRWTAEPDGRCRVAGVSVQ